MSKTAILWSLLSRKIVSLSTLLNINKSDRWLAEQEIGQKKKPAATKEPIEENTCLTKGKKDSTCLKIDEHRSNAMLIMGGGGRYTEKIDVMVTYYWTSFFCGGDWYFAESFPLVPIFRVSDDPSVAIAGLRMLSSCCGKWRGMGEWNFFCCSWSNLCYVIPKP